MAQERRLWGQLVEEAGWRIDAWSAGMLTINDVYDFGKAAAKEQADAQAKTKGR